jgi:hypothetical protein
VKVFRQKSWAGQVSLPTAREVRDEPCQTYEPEGGNSSARRQQDGRSVWRADRNRIQEVRKEEQFGSYVGNPAQPGLSREYRDNLPWHMLWQKEISTYETSESEVRTQTLSGQS